MYVCMYVCLYVCMSQIYPELFLTTGLMLFYATYYLLCLWAVVDARLFIFLFFWENGLVLAHFSTFLLFCLSL